MEFYLGKKHNKFIPTDTENQIKANKVKPGDVVKAKTINQRNYRFLQKFFVLMRFGFQHKPEYLDPHFPNTKEGKENFRKEVIKAAGYWHIEKDFNGKKRKVADSIAFDNMDEEIFDNLYSDCIDVFCRMLETDRQDLMEALMQFT